MEAPGMHPREQARDETISSLDLVSPEPSATYDAIIRLLTDALEAPIGLFSVVHGDKQFFKSRIGLDVQETARDISFCGHAILGEPELMVIDDALADPRFADNPLVTGEPGIRFYAGAVIKAPNNLPVGTVCVIDHQARELSEADWQRMLDAKHLMEMALLLKNEAVHDALTGLYNRRYFDRYIAQEWRRAYRHMLPLGVMLIDIDHFKALNDTLGHQAGDRALRRVAQAVADGVQRAGDLAARYGGEEFVVVLPDTDLDAADVIAERIRKQIADLGIENPSAPTRMLTASVGVAVSANAQDQARGHHELIGAADEALYEAKRAGRDRCVVRPMTRRLNDPDAAQALEPGGEIESPRMIDPSASD